MKNIYLISTVLCSVILFNSCEMDNFPGPDASLFGAIRDSLDGSFVEQDMLNGSRIIAYEHGYETPTAQIWDFKINGEYRNNLVFSNTYDLVFKSGNFFPFDVPDFEILPGENEHDFYVTPYMRVKNVDIYFDPDSNMVFATFSVQAGKSTAFLKRIELFVFTDIYVGDPYKRAVEGPGRARNFLPLISPDPNTVYKLKMNVGLNPQLFIPGRDLFFRVGALADGDNLSAVKFNYAPYVKIEF